MNIYTYEKTSDRYLLLSDLDSDWIPSWIDEDHFVDTLGENRVVWLSSIRDILRGGCASGSYMPAVTYYQASQTMSEHGDEGKDYCQSQGWELNQITLADHSWAGLACTVLSAGVELWAFALYSTIEHEGEEVELCE